MKKSIYSLAPLRQVLAAANHRYLEFISTLDDCSGGIKHLTKISRTVVDNERSYSGFNLFDEEDQTLFETRVAPIVNKSDEIGYNKVLKC